MKKTSTLFTLLIFCLAGFSQSNFQLGLRVSPNLNWIKPNSENLERDGLKFGFNFGLVGDFNFADNYSFSTGIGLANVGGKFIKPDIQLNPDGSGTSLHGQTNADVQLKYIEIPLTLKLKTNEIGYMKYFAQVGFGIGFNYDATADEEFTFNSNGVNGGTLSNDGVDYADEINALRASLILGLGGEYNLTGNTSLMLGLSFNNGFTNVFSEDIYAADENGNATTSNSDGSGVNERNQSAKAINNYVLINIGVLF